MVKRLVVVIELLALAASVVFVVMLFANEPDRSSSAAEGPGARLFQTQCASCHGADGTGAVGPRLAGRVADRYPDVEDEIELVTQGRNGMPAFGESLGPEEIRQVVEFTRSELGTSGYTP